MSENQHNDIPQTEATTPQLYNCIEIITETVKSDDYILNRLNNLHATDIQDEPEAIYGSGHSISAFITPEVKIYSDAMLLSKPYHLDDESIYYDLPEALKLVKQKFDNESELTPEDRAFNIALYAVHYVQFKYFNNTVGGSPKDRAGLMADILDLDEVDFTDDEAITEEKKVSIRDLKNNAMCMERAAVCHNLFVYLGIDSVLKIGDLTVNDNNENSEFHAWVEIKKADGTVYIFDPQNPHIVTNEHGQLVGAKPLVFKISDAMHVSTQWTHKNGQGDVIRSNNLLYKN